MDFINKYKLSLDWDEFDQSELFLVDKRSQIRTQLEMVTVPTELQRVHYLENTPQGTPNASSAALSFPPSLSPESVAFQVSCVQELDKDEGRPEDNRGGEHGSRWKRIAS